MKRDQEVVSFPGKKQKKWNGKRLKIYCGLMLIGFLLLILGSYYVQYYQLALQLDEINREEVRIEEKNRELEKEALLLQEDEYIEFLARRHLGLTRPGDDYYSNDY